MTRLHPRLRATAQSLIDELMFRFSIDSQQAQSLLCEVLKQKKIVNEVCVTVELRLMADDEKGGVS
jgi:hypothetical protein